MDVDVVAAEVASAVGLAEGPAGVRDVLRVIAHHEPVAAREVGRLAELPVPIVAAVCNELRKRGVVDRARPVRLTPAGRAGLALPAPGHRPGWPSSPGSSSWRWRACLRPSWSSTRPTAPWTPSCAGCCGCTRQARWPA